MTKTEYTLYSLSSALDEMKAVCVKLICLPSLKEKAGILYDEIQKEYERLYYENSMSCENH